MMNTHIRKLVAVVGATAVVGFAAGCGGSSSTATTNATANATNNAQQGARGGGQGGALPAATLKTLAAKLGVSTTQLQKAMAAARPTGGTASGTPPAQGSAPAAGANGAGGDMAAAIAKSLGLTTAKVQAALAAVMPAGGGGAGAGGAPPAAQGTTTTATS